MLMTGYTFNSSVSIRHIQLDSAIGTLWFARVTGYRDADLPVGKDLLPLIGKDLFRKPSESGTDLSWKRACTGSNK